MHDDPPMSHEATLGAIWPCPGPGQDPCLPMGYGCMPGPRPVEALNDRIDDKGTTPRRSGQNPLRCGPSHGRQQNTRSQNAYTCSSKPLSSSWEVGWADSYSNGRGRTTADGPGLEESLDDRGLSDSTIAGSVPSGTAKAQILGRDQKVQYFKQTQ